MRLTTLGTGSIAISPGRALAGYLIEAGDTRLLLDCGSGVVGRLASSDWMGITHVALSHFHHDHLGDLPTLIFAWRYGRLPARSEPVEILGPPGTRELLDRIAAAFGAWVTEPGFPLTVREVGPGERVQLGAAGATLEPRKVPHTDESVAYSVERDGRRIVYTGDTGFDDGLGAWAAGADVLLCECSLPDSMAVPIHLTPRECGALAAKASPGLLVLTHFYPPVERVDIRAEVGERFSGRVALATDGWSIEL
jgi:ribonuclease BN (tRNA processing enzyme)